MMRLSHPEIHTEFDSIGHVLQTMGSDQSSQEIISSVFENACDSSVNENLQMNQQSSLASNFDQETRMHF